MCKIKQFFIFLFLSLVSVAQNKNLIPNPSFEEYNHCPGDEGLSLKSSNLSDCKEWFNPTKASPDYYNKCATALAYSVPKNNDGTQNPQEGNAYAGIVYYADEENYEYIEVKLKELLLQNHTYCLSMFINLGDKETYCSNQIQFSLTSKKLHANNKKLLETEEYHAIINKNFIEDKTVWVNLKYEYKAKGNEEYLTIGLFNIDVPIKYLGKDKYKKSITNIHQVYGIYYYIDEVSLTEIIGSEKCSCAQTDSIQKETVKVQIVPSIYDSAVGKSLVLQNVNFEINKTTLLANSSSELIKIAEYLKQHVNYKAQLSGYTDNIGKEEENLKLSEGRAKAIADYLLQQGIEQNRISYKGYGSSKPIADNKTEEGRAKNRRVEVVFK